MTLFKNTISHSTKCIVLLKYDFRLEHCGMQILFNCKIKTWDVENHLKHNHFIIALNITSWIEKKKKVYFFKQYVLDYLFLFYRLLYLLLLYRKKKIWHDRTCHLGEESWKWKASGQLIQLLEKAKQTAFCWYVEEEGADGSLL